MTNQGEGERGLLPESHVLWARTAQGKVVGVEVEGRNVWQWRREYIELTGEFIKYAWHTTECARYVTEEHSHTTYKLTHGMDARAMCSELPCTCGLLIILSVMLHPQKMGFTCPHTIAQAVPVHPTEVDIHLDDDQGTTLPASLWGIPVVVSDDVPSGYIRVGDQEIEVTDADTGNRIDEGLRLMGHLKLFDLSRANRTLATQQAVDMGLLHFNRRKLGWPTVPNQEVLGIDTDDPDKV